MENNVECDDDEWVTFSFDGLGVELIHFVVSATKMFTDEDEVKMRKSSGDYLIKSDMMKRIAEVNQMASELLELMLEKGKSIKKNQST